MSPQMNWNNPKKLPPLDVVVEKVSGLPGPPDPMTPMHSRKVAQKAAIAMRGGFSNRNVNNDEFYGNANGNQSNGIERNSGSATSSQKSFTSKDVKEEEIANYIRKHPDFLEHYLMDEVEIEQLERWMIRRTQREKKMQNNARKTSLSRWKFCVHADKRQMLQQLTHSLQMCPTKAQVLYELSSCILNAVGADGFRLYLVESHDEPDQLTFFIDDSILDSNGEPKIQKIGEHCAIPQYVARTRESVRTSRNIRDPRFPEGLRERGVAHVLCQAIVYPDGNLVAVLELFRQECGPPFHEEDEEIAYSYLVWAGIALHYAHLFLTMNKQKKLNDFLLAVVKSIFQDMVSMDVLVIKIMNFAQRLVNADRASLFLIDSKSNELYATVFDLKDIQDIQENSPGANTREIKGEEIRFKVGVGIAGQCAVSGEVFNIIDAYSDPRFNPEVDQITGYKTETILCMPIFIRGSIIGVVEMINKRSGYFTKEDEEAFEVFAVYSGLALHHAKLYDRIRRSEQKYRVALEVLSYHNTAKDEELEKLKAIGTPTVIPDIEDYYFSPFTVDDFDKVSYAVFMFKDLFGLKRFDETCLMRFMLTVRKNYRRVPYHNWGHGFSVANSMYTILKRSNKIFRPNECLALFIGAICHDLDHRGKSNKFMLESESPLAAIYTTSTMEHHHFNQTVMILQQDGHNIFAKLNSVEYKQILSLVKHCILATDLALFFPNKAKLQTLVESERFSWSILEHRLLLEAIAMTASDLCASAKPWGIQVETVKVIFEEFYLQGDAEREAGRAPIPMMDRQQPEMQANSQVGFLTGICIPCYSLLHRLIPETKPMLRMCEQNLRRWRDIDEESQRLKQSFLEANEASKYWASERSLVVIKPDGVARGLIGSIIKQFEQKGYKLIALKFHWADQEILAKLNLRYLCSGPIVTMVWQGYNVIKCTNDLCNNQNGIWNIIQGSDSVSSAKKEISVWFKSYELC